MTPQAFSESKSPSQDHRSTYTRSSTELQDCHPAQLARARLSDTKGSVYLPADDLPTKTIAPSTLAPLFGKLEDSPPISHINPSTATFHNWNAFEMPQQSVRQEATPETSCDINMTRKRSLEGTAQSIDGVVEEGSPEDQRPTRRRRSVDPHQSGSTETVRVHFATDENLYQIHEREQGGAHYTRFLDPFVGLPASDERRFSASSDISAYLRPNAFARHRDTLARLELSTRCETDDDCQRSSRSNEHGSIEFVDEIVHRFPGHRDTLARLYFDRNNSKLIPFHVIDRILKLLSFQDYKNLRLTSRHWLEALPYAKMPASSRLPTEVLHQIYQSLQPCDFDAARHTCRSWFLASLDRKLGRQMMKQAGCYPAFNADLEQRQRRLHSHRMKSIIQAQRDYNGRDLSDCHLEVEESFNEEWMVSKRLATECRLSAAWHGSGITNVDGSAPSRLSVRQVVNFNKLDFPSANGDIRAKKFTVSACGKFLLLVVGTDIFVYSLTSQPVITPCVRLVTGKEVMSVSMDTSSGRFAVAALLEGRAGMCWDLQDLFTASIATEAVSVGLVTDIYGPVPTLTLPTMPMSLPTRQEEYGLTLDGSEADEEQFNFGSGATTPSLVSSPDQLSSADPSEFGSPEAADSLLAVPIRTRPTHLYKNLGCTSDEPRSVAICPQRKCVAFGCRAGIELHWVDALTGRDLNRWFPLAAPSDHLYFLPQRPNMDTSKKLRLISSAAGPTRRTNGRHNSSPGKSKFSPSGRLHGRQQSMTRLFFGDLPFPASFATNQSRSGGDDERETRGILRTVDCDHYQAVPLSDGAHVLFTDPATGLLCLGSDAPLGGPTKLIRKVSMIPPTSDDMMVGSLSCYAAGQDLSWGVRVVAAYDDGSIVLYSIPSDCFERIRNIRSSADVWDEMSGVLGQSDLLMDALTNRLENVNGLRSTADTPAPGSLSSFRSLQIRGALICRVDSNVEDLQLDSAGGGLRLWIFHHNGKAQHMDIYAPGDHQTQNYDVGVDGLLHNLSKDSTAQQAGRTFGIGRNNTASSHQRDSTRSVKFLGLDGAYDHNVQSDFEFDEDLKLLEELNTQSHLLSPDPVILPEIQRNVLDDGRKFQLQVFTDWRDTILFSPYLVSLE